jgi:hypothetical protein
VILLMALAIHGCTVPRAAYVMDRDLSARELRSMERFGHCLCGPDGTVDWDPRPHNRGEYFMHPSCNSNGWNGHRYINRKA